MMNKNVRVLDFVQNLAEIGEIYLFKHTVSVEYVQSTFDIHTCAGIFKQSMGARNRVGIGLSYRPVRLHSLAELVP